MNRYAASLRDKRILVTGGTTGIGRATLQRLVEEGARVFTFGRDPAALEETLRSVEGMEGEAFGLSADVSYSEEIRRIFAGVDETLGGLDILVACAALGAKPIHEMTDEAWREVVDVNLVGYMACARAALERFEAAGGGHLLFVGSVSIDLKVPGESVYSATKAGVQAFAETLRKEVAERNVRVSVIQPGSAATDMQECSQDEKREAIERHEMLHAGEIAEAILFALTRSERADVVNIRIEPRLQKTA